MLKVFRDHGQDAAEERERSDQSKNVAHADGLHPN